MLDDREIWKAAGKRLAAARLRAGYVSQKMFADALGRSEPAIAKYEQGVREIPLAVLMWLAERHRINANWVITGRGDTFDDQSNVTEAPVQPDRRHWRGTDADAELFLRIGDLVRLVHEQQGIDLPPRAFGKAARAMWEEVVATLDADAGPDEIAAVLAFQTAKLRRQLLEAAADPGTGKRSAS